MMKRLVLCLVVLFAVSGIFGLAKAALVSVSGPNSSMGTAPAIIPPPPHALDDVVTNTGMQGFDEAQGVVTTVAHNIDGAGSIPAGTLVDSHMIFLNSEGIASLSHLQVDWTFSGQILGIMSDTGGTLEAASTFELGAPGTNYTVAVPPDQAAPYPARGLEAQGGGGGVVDGYAIIGPQTLRVDMRVSEPGDWIRVVTLNPRGCSLGFWKNNPDDWPGEYSPGDEVDEVFQEADGIVGATDTLMMALKYKGKMGPAHILLRNAVAALLNSVHPATSGPYPKTEAEVIEEVNDALASGDPKVMLAKNAELNAYNNGVCPLEDLADQPPVPAPGKHSSISTLWGEIKAK